MPQEVVTAEGLLRESRAAERALIEAETCAERQLLEAEERYQIALEKLVRAEERLESRRRELDQARAQLDQCQLERAAGPMIRRTAIDRPSLPRPARDDSRARTRRRNAIEPAPEGTGSTESNPKNGQTPVGS